MPSPQESTSIPGRIQLSKDTATLIAAAGKDTWLQLREDAVSVKGKGTMETFWLRPGLDAGSDLGNSSHHRPSASGSANQNPAKESKVDIVKEDQKRVRLINWQVDVFVKLLKQVVARRQAVEGTIGASLRQQVSTRTITGSPNELVNPMKEIKEIIELPLFDSRAAALAEKNLDKVKLDPAVIEQLRAYITTISHMYRDNEFHNFEVRRIRYFCRCHRCRAVCSRVQLLSACLSRQYERNQAPFAYPLTHQRH